MPFYVGAKVVCVDDSWNRCDPVVRRGGVYTISEIIQDGSVIFGVQLYGVSLPRGGGWWIGWKPSRFRLLDERKTDISIFRKLLTPSPESVNA